MLPRITGEFRAGAEPDLRFTPSGKAVANVRAVASSRRNNGTQQNPDWVDDKTCWVTLTCWEKLAENMAETVQTGTLLTVIGDLEINEWTDNDNNKRITPVIHVRSMGPAITWDPAQVLKKDEPRQQQSRQQGQQSRQQQNPSGGDPWAAPQNDEPPF